MLRAPKLMSLGYIRYLNVDLYMISYILYQTSYIEYKIYFIGYYIFDMACHTFGKQQQNKCANKKSGNVPNHRRCGTVAVAVIIDRQEFSKPVFQNGTDCHILVGGYSLILASVKRVCLYYYVSRSSCIYCVTGN